MSAISHCRSCTCVPDIRRPDPLKSRPVRGALDMPCISSRCHPPSIPTATRHFSPLDHTRLPIRGAQLPRSCLTNPSGACQDMKAMKRPIGERSSHVATDTRTNINRLLRRKLLRRMFSRSRGPGATLPVFAGTTPESVSSVPSREFLGITNGRYAKNYPNQIDDKGLVLKCQDPHVGTFRKADL